MYAGCSVHLAVYIDEDPQSLLATYHDVKPLLLEFRNFLKGDEGFLNSLPESPSALSSGVLKNPFSKMCIHLDQAVFRINADYNSNFAQLLNICKVPQGKTDTSLREIADHLKGEVAERASVLLWNCMIDIGHELKFKTLEADLSERSLAKVLAEKEQYRKALMEKPTKTEERKAERTVGRLTEELKAAATKEREQQKQVDELSASLRSKQSEAHQLQKQIKNGIRKLRSLAGNTDGTKGKLNPKVPSTATSIEDAIEMVVKWAKEQQNSSTQTTADVQELAGKLASLQNQRHEAKTSRQQLDGQLQQALQDVTRLGARVAEIECKVECGICSERDVDVVFHCDHTICGKCDNGLLLRGEGCPYCRRRIGYRKKLCLGA